ncbi:MAG: hypothetical protein ACR2QH_15215 [Geminicoccaceae bacterium]
MKKPFIRLSLIDKSKSIFVRADRIVALCSELDRFGETYASVMIIGMHKCAVEETPEQIMKLIKTAEEEMVLVGMVPSSEFSDEN